MKYLSRLIDIELEKKLKSCGGVLVQGPKWCGKSTTCERFAKSVTSLKTNSAIELAKADPISTLHGATPHLIDEWQKVPEIWNLVRAEIDNRQSFSQFILTGSTTPADISQLHHSGAGRVVPLTMRPLSLYESKDSNGSVSLSDLFYVGLKSSQKSPIENNPMSLFQMAFLMCRGGWPTSVTASQDIALDVTRNYYEGLLNIEDESDEFYEFIRNKDIDLLKLIIKSYARYISTEAKKTSMINDIINSGQRAKLDEDTFNQYLNIIKHLYIVEDMPAWNFNLRSSVAIRTSPTHHFIDTSIALAALGIGPNELINDLKSMGMFFEDMGVRDLTIYSSSLGASLRHYRDSNGLEVDTILSLSNGEYAAIEIKIRSDNNIATGVTSLLNFEKQMVRNGLPTPKIKMILTSHGECTSTEEGIFIVPINYLKP